MGVGKRRGAALVIGLAVASLAACSGSSRPVAQQHSPTPSPVPSTSLSPTAEQLAVERAYVSFWRVLPRASRVKSDSDRLALLVPVATDPELSQLISGIAKERSKGRVFYGVDRPRVTSVAVTGDRATVVDCQDSSAAGVQSVKSGDKLTVGVARHPVHATLLLRQGSWKVSVVSYPPSGTRC